MSLIVYCNTGCIWHHYVDSTTHSSKHIWKMFRNMPITPSRRMALFYHIDLYLSSRFFVSLELISTTSLLFTATRFTMPKNMHLLVNKYQSCIDSNDDSLNSSHQFPWHTLTYMTILQIPVICFPDIRWLIWRFFEFQSSAFPAFVDLYGNSSNSSHQFIRHLLTYMAILRILVISLPGICWLIWRFFEF